MAEVRLSQLEYSGRLDSEYYKPSHLSAEQILIQKGGGLLERLCDFLIGPFGSAFTTENYTADTTYRYVRGKDVKAMTLVENDNVYLPKSDFDRLSKYALRAGDILVSVVGTIGQAALVEAHHVPAIFSCKNTVLRCKNIDPKYLVAYLNSSFGYKLLTRKERGAVQKGLNLDDLKTLLIFPASAALQARVALAIDAARLAKEASKEFLRIAETTLLQALNLSNWQAPEPLSYTRSSSDAFAAERLDAEYFHPAKTAALAALQAHSHFTVGDLFVSVRELWQPDDWKAGTTVRNYDLSDALSPFLDASKQPTDVELIASTKKVIQAGDLVVSRLRSYLKEIAVVLPSDNTRMVASSEFIVLRPRAESFPTEVLMVYLRSVLPQVVFKWSQDGSNHPRFNEKELLALPVPHMEEGTQETIKAAVLASRQAKQRATQLLDAAKRAVEIAIEESEDAALAHLQLVAND